MSKKVLLLRIFYANHKLDPHNIIFKRKIKLGKREVMILFRKFGKLALWSWGRSQTYPNVLSKTEN